jgi:DNA transformation protein
MAVSDGFKDYAVEQLGRLVTGVRTRKMFGGVSIAAPIGTFALIDDDVLYLKGDAACREAFETAGWPPFRPFGPEGSAMGYFAVPGDLLDTPEELEPYVDLALAAAGRAGRSKRTRRHT